MSMYTVYITDKVGFVSIIDEPLVQPLPHHGGFKTTSKDFVADLICDKSSSIT